MNSRSSKKPRAEHQGGTVPVPAEPLANLLSGLGALKASINDQWSGLLQQATEARIETERLKVALAQMTRERDAALAALAGKSPEERAASTQFKDAEAKGQLPLLSGQVAPKQSASDDPDLSHLFGEEAR